MTDRLRLITFLKFEFKFTFALSTVHPMAEAESKQTLETKLLDKVGEAISSINDAKRVDQVIFAVHSVALLIFPVDPAARIGDKYGEKVLYLSLSLSNFDCSQIMIMSFGRHTGL